MTVRIGHASIDENGRAAGGAAGDQTGKEVRIRNWYNGGWGFVARAKDPAVAEKIAAACEEVCNNPNVGYDQSGRNTLMTEARLVDFIMSKITNACECDCSSLVSVCVRAALGGDFYSGNAPTTSTLKSVLSATGAFDILTDSKYLTSCKHLRRGDIPVKPASHTVIVLDDGGGAEDTGTTTAQTVTTYNVALPLLKKGTTGDSVKAMQILLIGWGYDCGKYGADGDFGSATETALKAFQAAMGLEADGKCGPKTWGKLLGM